MPVVREAIRDFTSVPVVKTKIYSTAEDNTDSVKLSEAEIEALLREAEEQGK